MAAPDVEVKLVTPAGEQGGMLVNSGPRYYRAALVDTRKGDEFDYGSKPVHIGHFVWANASSEPPSRTDTIPRVEAGPLWRTLRTDDYTPFGSLGEHVEEGAMDTSAYDFSTGSRVMSVIQGGMSTTVPVALVTPADMTPAEMAGRTGCELIATFDNLAAVPAGGRGSPRLFLVDPASAGTRLSDRARLVMKNVMNITPARGFDGKTIYLLSGVMR